MKTKHPYPRSRRAFLKRSAALTALAAVPQLAGRSQTSGETHGDLAARLAADPWLHEYRYGHMIQEYYVRRFREIAARRAEQRAAVQTPVQVQRLREEVRRKLRACYGPLPEKTPLKPRVTGRVDREAYTIEKLIYESRPGYLVTANVYVPKARSGRRPAVLGTCGHSDNGKASETYQAFARNLARQGYVVLVYDPPSQGERLEYPDRPAQPPIRAGVHSHNVAGNQMTLVGRCFAQWEAWDGIRGVDYLLTRDDVDPERIGVTGNSGGGTQTCHLNALEDRFAMAAPSCFVTRFLYNLENEEPTDSEQVVPGMVAAGLDMADFFVARLPRPTLLTGQVNDFFDVRGLRETYQELRRLYGILGKEDNVELYVGPGTHGYHQEARENMYRFFNRHADNRADPREPDAPIEPDAVLQATPRGQVHLMGSKRSFDFTRQEAARQAAARSGLSGAPLARAIERHLALPGRSGPPRFRTLRAQRAWSRPGLWDSGFVIETERSIRVMLHAIPRRGPLYYFPEGRRATIYLPDRSSLQEMILGKAKEIQDQPIRFALDVRGMGRMTARTHKDRGQDFFHPYHTDYLYANEGLLLGEPYCGRRVLDLLRVLDLFQSYGYQDLHLVGRGLGAITTVFAGVLHPIVKRVTLHDALMSYHELTQDPRYQWPQSSMVYRVLEALDLPDCLRELNRAKSLQIIDPWTSRRERFAKEAFHHHAASLGLSGLTVTWEA